MQTPPHAYPQQQPPPPALSPDERARRIEAYVSGRFLPRFAPTVERLADWQERRARLPDASPLLRPAPALRPATRKVLAFDPSVRDAALLALGCGMFLGVCTLVVLLALVGPGTRSLRGFEKTIPGILIMGAGVVSLPFMLSGQLRERRRVLARCAVVPARITDVLPVGAGWSSLMIMYWYDGIQRWQLVRCRSRECALISWTPDVLVDTAAPGGILIKDFYV